MGQTEVPRGTPKDDIQKEAFELCKNEPEVIKGKVVRAIEVEKMIVRGYEHMNKRAWSLAELPNHREQLCFKIDRVVDSSCAQPESDGAKSGESTENLRGPALHCEQAM